METVLASLDCRPKVGNGSGRLPRRAFPRPPPPTRPCGHPCAPGQDPAAPGLVHPAEPQWPQWLFLMSQIFFLLKIQAAVRGPCYSQGRVAQSLAGFRVGSRGHVGQRRGEARCAGRLPPGPEQPASRPWEAKSLVRPAWAPPGRRFHLRRKTEAAAGPGPS